MPGWRWSGGGGALLPADPAGHALISGGSSGIGLALAHRLGVAGWDLTILARDPERLAQAQAALAVHGRAVVIHSADVADAAAVAEAIDASVRRLGPPGLVVACAGMVIPGELEAQPADAFRRSIEVNYLGALHLVQAALPAMRARGGRIVLVASGAALVGLYGYSSYAPSKFAVRGLAEALRSELSAGRIGVSVVYPPDTDTPGFRAERRARPEIVNRLAGAGGLLTADQVAQAIMRGVARGRFAITPGLPMTALAWLHSLAVPVLNRFWFDPLIARAARAGDRAGLTRGGHPEQLRQIARGWGQGRRSCRLR